MSFEDFENNEHTFLNLIYEHQYIFELRKCCGYKEWVSVYKTMTTEDLYVNIYRQFKANPNKHPPIRLFLLGPSGEKIELERNNTILIRDMILAHPTHFKAVYQMPCRVIYWLYIDDGHCHLDHSGATQIG